MKTTLFTIYSSLLFSICAQASTSYYSRQNGAYNVASTWSNTSHVGPAAASPPCTCGPCTVNGSNHLYISNALTISCDLAFTGNPTITIENGGSLSVTGNASVSGSATFTIDAGGTVDVTGNFNVNGGGGSVTINGTLNVSGVLTINGGFPFCGTGNVNANSQTGTGSACGTLSMALPVRWLGFDVKYLDNKAELDWSTASEVNNDYFTIEKSSDGFLYSELMRIDGAGNTTSVHAYKCLDVAPLRGINYYRIKQTDFDGHIEYYKVIALFVSDAAKSITIYPSLVRNSLVNINFTGCEKETANISLLDIKGNVIQHRGFLISNNHEQILYPLPAGLSSNAYFINIISGEYFNTQKIIISSY